MNKCFVFRSLPFFADSRIERNCNIFSDNSISCTWEKNDNNLSKPNSVKFPFYKGGNFLLKIIKYVIFLFWIPIFIIKNSNKNDIVVFMDLETIIFGGFAAKYKKLNIVFDIVDPFSQTKKTPKFLSFLIDRVEYLWASSSDVITVPHESRIKFYSDRINKEIDSNKVIIIENVPDYNEANISDKKFNLLNKIDEKITIGYFGTLDRNTRAIEFLTELVIKNDSVYKLVIAGQGALELELKALSEKYENISFLGAYKSSELYSLYSLIDFTWAYYSDNVPLHFYAAPNKFYEHIFYKTPIITSNIIPQCSVINELCSGILINVNDDSLENIDNKIRLFHNSDNNYEISLSEYWCNNYNNYYSRIKCQVNNYLKAIV